MNPDPIYLPPANPMIINDPYSQNNVAPVRYVNPANQSQPEPDQVSSTRPEQCRLKTEPFRAICP